MHSPSPRLQSHIAGIVFALTAIATWLLVHGYHGLIGDAQLYAFQALARIHPALASDLYLQNTSQDQFTIFSPFYAWFIKHLGLEQSARLLTILFSIWFLTAAWWLARYFTSRDGAWLAVISLLILGNGFGGSGVFRFEEEFITARLPAEALIVTSLVFFLRGFKPAAILTVIAALLIHPLIALPGLLILLCLSAPISASILGAAGCVVTASLIVLGTTMHWTSNFFPIIDAEWLTVVQERSQFLFLQLWSFRDWELNVRPFFYLAFIAFVIDDARVRRVCGGAALVALTGLIVAFIAGFHGPVALLVQGQAWRWVWIATFISGLLLPATMLQLWPDKQCGQLCAALSIVGVTVPGINGTACVSIALLFWLARSGLSIRLIAVLRWTFWMVIGATAVWIVVQISKVVWPGLHASTPISDTQFRDFPALKLLAAISAAFIWQSLQNRKSVRTPAFLSASLLLLSGCSVPMAFSQQRRLGTPANIAEFTNWARLIPPTSTVLVTPARDVGAFVWFTLQRPNYLSVNQSAGVVFSRNTALEVVRRSQNLLPVMDENWKIRTSLRAGASAETSKASASRTMTVEALNRICTDPQLGFVISPVRLGSIGIPHKISGPWMDWNLYDCRAIAAQEQTR